VRTGVAGRAARASAYRVVTLRLAGGSGDRLRQRGRACSRRMSDPVPLTDRSGAAAQPLTPVLACDAPTGLLSGEPRCRR
jgi:hypothetical protein